MERADTVHFREILDKTRCILLLAQQNKHLHTDQVDVRTDHTKTLSMFRNYCSRRYFEIVFLFKPEK